MSHARSNIFAPRAAALALVLLVGACSADPGIESGVEAGDSSPTVTSSPPPAAEPTLIPTPEPTVTSDDDADHGEGDPPPEGVDLSDVWGVDLSLVELPGDTEYYEDWTWDADDSRFVRVTTPEVWTDLDTSLGFVDGVGVPSVWASPDLDALLHGYEVPGVKVAFRSDELTIVGIDAWLAELVRLNAVEANCDGHGDFAYDDDIHVGAAELWLGCGEPGAALLLVAARPPHDVPGTLTLEVQMVTERDVYAAVGAMNTWEFLGYGSLDDLPHS
ncbi:MAG: hypothetical protein KDB21_03040 [Acidimicrobiales bacterium]|nr:hypothetical protein [Acidimicrobiales bacterium]